MSIQLLNDKISFDCRTAFGDKIVITLLRSQKFFNKKF